MRLKDLKIKYFKGKPPRIKEGASLLPYLTPDYIRKGSTPEYYPMQSGVVLVEDDELILLWDGSNAGEFFKGKKGILSSTMVKFDKVDEANDEYFYYSLKLQEQTLKSKTAGSGIPHVDKDSLYNLEIYLPEKSHQSTIATILTTIDQSLEKTEQLIAKYERIKTGLMQDLLTCGIDEQGNIRSEETHEFKDSVLGRIPKEWEIYSIDKVCLNVIDCPHSTPEYLKGGILVARTMHIKNGQYDIQNTSYVSEEEYINRIQRLEPHSGDIIFTREAPVGEAFIVPEGMKICLGQRVMQLRPNLVFCLPEYLLELIYSEKTRLRFDGIVGGTTNPHLNVSDVKKFEFAVPKPDEQIRICNSLKGLRDLLNKEQDNLKKATKLKTALMQDLLTGKVRVDALN